MKMEDSVKAGSCLGTSCVVCGVDKDAIGDPSGGCVEFVLKYCQKSAGDYLDANGIVLLSGCGLCKACFTLISQCDLLSFELGVALDALRERSDVTRTVLNSADNSFSGDILGQCTTEISFFSRDHSKELSEQCITNLADEGVSRDPLNVDEDLWKIRKNNSNLQRKAKQKIENVHDKELLPCEFCHRKFFTKSARTRHVAKAHPENYPRLPSDIICDCCGKIFRTKVAIQVHRKERRYDYGGVCDVCGVRTVDVKRHTEMSHGTGLKCRLCPEIFRNFHERKVHMIDSHGVGSRQKRTMYSCSECTFSSDSRPKYLQHQASKHGHLPSESDTFRCIVCEKAFYSRAALRDHTNGHMGINPYKCLGCNYSSHTENNLRIHVKQVHKMTLGKMKEKNRALKGNNGNETSPVLPGKTVRFFVITKLLEKNGNPYTVLRNAETIQLASESLAFLPTHAYVSNMNFSACVKVESLPAGVCLVCGGEASVSCNDVLSSSQRSVRQFFREHTDVMLVEVTLDATICLWCFELLGECDRLYTKFDAKLNEVKKKHLDYQSGAALIVKGDVEVQITETFQKEEENTDGASSSQRRKRGRPKRFKELPEAEEVPLSRKRGPRRTVKKAPKQEVSADEYDENDSLSDSSSDPVASFQDAITLPNSAGSFPCSHCVFESTTMQGLKVHAAAQHPKAPVGCRICGNEFPSRNERNKHEKEFHPGASVPKASLFCDCCGKTFKSVGSLKIHRGEYRYDYSGICEICGEHAKNVKVHMSSKHRGPLKCSICHVTCTNYSSRRTHMLREHGVGKAKLRSKYNCPECPKDFWSKPKMIRHRVMRHNFRPDPEFIFTCEFCQKEFYCKDTWREHVNGHLGITPYHCPLCSYATNIDSNLHIHMRQVHKVRLSVAKAAVKREQSTAAAEAPGSDGNNTDPRNSLGSPFPKSQRKQSSGPIESPAENFGLRFGMLTKPPSHPPHVAAVKAAVNVNGGITLEDLEATLGINATDIKMTEDTCDADYVTVRFLETVLPRSAKTSMVVNDFTTSKGCANNDGFLSTLHACTVDAIVDGTAKKYELMLKKLPKDAKTREFLIKTGWHEHEIRFYSQVAPKMQQFVQEYAKNVYRLPVPEFYGICNVEGEDDSVIVMGNLKKADPAWTSISLKDGIDQETFPIVCSSLAKIHAVPLAMRANVGAESVSDVIPAWKSLSFGPSVLDDLLNNGFRDLKAFLKQQRPDWTPDGKDWKNLVSLAKFGLENADLPLRLETVCHADVWNGNLLFRGSSKSGKPDDCVMLDWQMASAKSPAVDICNVLFFCTRFTSEQDLQLRLHEYWDILADALMNFNVNLEKDLQYSWSDFVHDFPVSQAYAVVNWSCSMDMMFSYSGEEMTKRILSWYDYFSHKDWTGFLNEWMYSV
ncbi:unnamed protein product [Notodromas monacha]|uniref:C2H2-type domain-containing protein n=1 Tax=Notodromas monacha TaxID=399045 RepID=A0A7R9BF40_9CRUS|nr:unnamed protein product [Notodromas monacha]CAG0914146.1 unnamed protein product [Notodromas monacha]